MKSKLNSIFNLITHVTAVFVILFLMELVITIEGFFNFFDYSSILVIITNIILIVLFFKLGLFAYRNNKDL
jgi:hypothetical protein